MEQSGIKIGDRFHKAEDQNRKPWVVIDTFYALDGLAHARLENRLFPGDVRTIGVHALRDPKFFRPLKP